MIGKRGFRNFNKWKIFCDFWKTSGNLVMDFRKVKLILGKSVLDFGYKSDWMIWKTLGK